MAGDLKGDHYKPRSTVKHKANVRLIALLAVSALTILYLLFGGGGGPGAASSYFRHDAKGKLVSDFKNAASDLSGAAKEATSNSKKGTQFKTGGEKLRAPGENEGARMRDNRKFTDEHAPAADGGAKANGGAGAPAAAAAGQKKTSSAPPKGRADPAPPKKGKPVVPPAADKIPSKDGKPGQAARDAAAAAAAKAGSAGKDIVDTAAKAVKKATSGDTKSGSSSSSVSKKTTKEKFDADAGLQDLLDTYPIILFSKSYCPHSARAKRVLDLYDIDPRPLIFELDREAHGEALQAALGELTGRSTVPNLMVGGYSLGGGDEVAALDDKGQLVAAIRKHNKDIDASLKAAKGKS